MKKPGTITNNSGIAFAFIQEDTAIRQENQWIDISTIMSYETNALHTQALGNITARASGKVLGAIERASSESGVDFSYLVQQAAAESNFNINAKAKTSSATGLYQFIDSTWLSMLDRYADQYNIDTNGKTKAELLDMRKDPQTASFMAAAFASENENFLNSHWGGEVGATELYMTHFLGASGGASFLNARDENPLTPAADLFPRAAQANRTVFYDKETGKPKSLEAVYQFFDKKFQIKSDNPTPQINIASIPQPPEIPTQKTAQYESNAPHQISDSIIMKRAQAMRDAIATKNYGYVIPPITHNALLAKSRIATQAGAVSPDTKTAPFFSMITKPVDIMLLTQTTPTKTIRDNS